LVPLEVNGYRRGAAQTEALRTEFNSVCVFIDIRALQGNINA